MGRFLNADAFASTGQGILGNNMFAYCGNNPVNCSDPTGQKFSTAANHKNAVHFKSEGAQGSAFDQFMQGTSDFVQLVSGEQILDAGYYIITAGASVAFGIVYSFSKPITFFIDALVTFDDCRYAGLDFDISVLTAMACAIATNRPLWLSLPNEGFCTLLSFNFLSDWIKECAINGFMPEPNAAMQNRIQHISQRTSGVTVGGSLRFTQFTDDWRDGVSVRP